MRAPRFSALCLLLSFGCQDGYPIPPTRCDEWCDASQALQCGNYNPATCVAACESQELDAPQCKPALDAALACIRSKTPAELDCRNWVPFGKPAPCTREETALLTCGHDRSSESSTTLE